MFAAESHVNLHSFEYVSVQIIKERGTEVLSLNISMYRIIHVEVVFFPLMLLYYCTTKEIFGTTPWKGQIEHRWVRTRVDLLPISYNTPSWEANICVPVHNLATDYPGGGGHSHMEVTGLCGHDPQSRGLSVTN